MTLAIVPDPPWFHFACFKLLSEILGRSNRTVVVSCYYSVDFSGLARGHRRRVGDGIAQVQGARHPQHGREVRDITLMLKDLIVQCAEETRQGETFAARYLLQDRPEPGFQADAGGMAVQANGPRFTLVRGGVLHDE